MKRFLKKWFEQPSNIYLLVFILIFASAGSILLFGSHAATTNKTPIQGLLDRGGLNGSTFNMPNATELSQIDGVVANVSWLQLQPSGQGGTINATNQLNSALQQVASYNSTHSHQLEVKARIFAGTDSPNWAKAIDGWNPVNICNSQRGGNNCGTIGPFWTTDYDNAYKTFMVDLANATDIRGYTYDNDPLLHDVTIAQCMTIYAEPFQRDDINLGQVLYETSPTQPTYTGLLYSPTNDENCLLDSVDNMGTAWKHTNTSYSFNPFKPWTSATNQSGQNNPYGEYFTNVVMQHCRSVLGSQCTLENNSIRDSYIGEQNQSGNLYSDITNKGTDITYQTATNNAVGNLDSTIAWAAQIGANAVELPGGYSLTSSQMSTLSAALFANPIAGNTMQQPSITSVSPTSGTTSGGTSVSIVIANFPSGTPSVTFGGTAGTGIIRSGNTVTVNTPAHAAGAVNVIVTVGSSSATDASGYTFTTPPPQFPDLIVQSLSVSPASPVIGDDVTFSMVIKNQGTAAVPSGTAIGGAFLIDGSNVTLERGYSSGLAVGSTATLVTNQGAAGNPNSFWIAVAGNHTLEGFVNDLGTIQESNSSNNTLSQSLNVPNPPPPQAPHPPANLSSPSQTTSSITLSWTASVPGTNGDPASKLVYHIKRNGTEVGHTAMGVTSYTDSGLSPATTYSYTIFAEDTANRSSADSNAFTKATASLNCPAPPAPGNLHGSAGSDGTTVALSWNAVTATPPCAIAHYEVEQNGITIAQVTTTSDNVTNLTPATTYTFSVLAVTNDSKPGALASIQVTTATITDTTPPTAPTSVAAIPVSDTQINLTWVAAADAQSGIKNYQIERDGQVIGSTTTTSFGDSNLTAATSYTYIVIAVNGVNLTTASTPVTVSTLAAPNPGGGGGNGGGGGGTNNPPLVPLLQNTTSVGSGTDTGSGSDLTYNPTVTNPVSDNPSAGRTTPNSTKQVKTLSVGMRLVYAFAGLGLIVLALLGTRVYLRRRVRSQFAKVKKLGLAPPDIAAFSQDMGNSRLTAGTIISPDAPAKDKEKHK